MGNGVILFDSSGNPLTAVQNSPIQQPVSGTPTQSGLIMAGSDYTASAKAQLVKTDSAGTLYVTSTAPGGAAALVYNSQSPPAASGQYGPLTMIRQDTPAPSTYAAATADMLGSLYVHARSKPTFRAIARQVTSGQNKYLYALTNPSSQTYVLRLYEVRVYVTPAGTAGFLLGSSGSTYYPMFLEIYRVSAANVSGGASVPIVSCDTNDACVTGVAAVSSPTVSSYVSSLFRCDAVLANAVGTNFYERRDLNNEKPIVIRPGEGMALICLSNGTVASATGGTTANAPVDITFVWSQAPA